MAQAKIAPWHPAELAVTGTLNQRPYQMVDAARVEATPRQLENIARVCNQTAIYDFLFRARLGGNPYQTCDAAQFLTWAAKGWREQTHFVFLLLDSAELVVGALDIKSAAPAGAEIGYWCSNEHRGLMTNAVKSLTELARAAGFISLWARVRKDNAASIRVLQRNGFTFKGDWAADATRDHYELRL